MTGLYGVLVLTLLSAPSDTADAERPRGVDVGEWRVVPARPRPGERIELTAEIRSRDRPTVPDTLRLVPKLASAGTARLRRPEPEAPVWVVRYDVVAFERGSFLLPPPPWSAGPASRTRDREARATLRVHPWSGLGPPPPADTIPGPSGPLFCWWELLPLFPATLAVVVALGQGGADEVRSGKPDDAVPSPASLLADGGESRPVPAPAGDPLAVAVRRARDLLERRHPEITPAVSLEEAIASLPVQEAGNMASLLRALDRIDGLRFGAGEPEAASLNRALRALHRAVARFSVGGSGREASSGPGEEA